LEVHPVWQEKESVSSHQVNVAWVARWDTCRTAYRSIWDVLQSYPVALHVSSEKRAISPPTGVLTGVVDCKSFWLKEEHKLMKFRVLIFVGGFRCYQTLHTARYMWLF